MTTRTEHGATSKSAAPTPSSLSSSSSSSSSSAAAHVLRGLAGEGYAVQAKALAPLSGGASKKPVQAKVKSMKRDATDEDHAALLAAAKEKAAKRPREVMAIIDGLEESKEEEFYRDADELVEDAQNKADEKRGADRKVAKERFAKEDPVAEAEAWLAQHAGLDAAATSAALKGADGAALSRGAKVHIMSEAVQTNYAWKNDSAAAHNDFAEFTSAAAEDAAGATAKLDTKTMNCWESVMYTGYLAGAVSFAELKHFGVLQDKADYKHDRETDMLPEDEHIHVYMTRAGAWSEATTRSVIQADLAKEVDDGLTLERALEQISEHEALSKKASAKVDEVLPALLQKLKDGGAVPRVGLLAQYNTDAKSGSHYGLTTPGNNVISLHDNGEGFAKHKVMDITAGLGMALPDNLAGIAQFIAFGSVAYYLPPWEI